MLPGPTLRSRQVLPDTPREPPRGISLLPDGELVVLYPGDMFAFGMSRTQPAYKVSVHDRPGALEGGRVLGREWLAVVEFPDGGMRVRLIERSSDRECARFFFAGPTPLSVRLLEQDLLLFDESGRLVRVELTRGQVRRVVPR